MRETSISAEVDEVELEDGTKVQPVSVTFPQGNTIPAQTQDQRKTTDIQKQEVNAVALMCNVSFCSDIPLSLCTTITFTDHLYNRFQAKLCATADNCLLTVWTYMALQCSKQHVVLKTGVICAEEGQLQVVLQQHHSPSPPSVPTSLTPSSFDHLSSSNKTSESETSRDEDVCPSRDVTINPGVPEFPAANLEDGLYCQSVLLAVERSVLDMLHHLTGKQIPGMCPSLSLSNNIDQRTNQLLQQHKAMLAFLRVQGACLCHVRPEYLLDKQEFNHWCSLQAIEEENGLDSSTVDYESMSKRSWTDVLLQIYKVLVLRRVSERSLNTTLNQEDMDEILPFSSQPLYSNIYSAWELRLLSWLNMHYQHMRTTVWGTGGITSARWIVNFHLDLADGLVLASLLAAYCPYLICSHFRRMYSRMTSLEQKLHNNIIVVQALNTLSLNIDVQPTDLSDPNPVQMLMLCVHLYERLPQYVPLHTISLSGGLHRMFSKQVRLKNPTSKPLKYQAALFGEEAHLFSFPHGPTVTIPPKSSSGLSVQYSCSFLQLAHAVLLLTSTSTFGLQASALAFNLKTHISHITPTKTVKCESPCYQLKLIQLPITNLFNKEAEFRVVLVESRFNPLEPEKTIDSLSQQTSKTDSLEKTSDSSFGKELEGESSDLKGDVSEFCCVVKSVSLKPGQADTLNIDYLPFHLGTKYCSVLLVCPRVGDMVYMVMATAELPLPSLLTARPSSNIVPSLSSSDSGACEPMLSLRCNAGQVCEEVVCVPVVNAAREEALAFWGQHTMNADEQRRRMLTGTLHGSTVRATAAARKLTKQQVQLMSVVSHSEGVEYSVEVSLPELFTLPETVTIPIGEDTNTPQLHPAEFEVVDIPVRFQSNSVGQFQCQVVLRSWWDTRVYLLEALVTSQDRSTHWDFKALAHHSVTQDIPLHNETHQDWNLQAKLCGEGFYGPKVLNVPAGTRVCYPLTFHPSAHCIVMGKLCLHNDCDSAKHLFTLRGVGEHPLPVDHVVIHCAVGQPTHTQLDVPNYSHHKLTLQVVTDLSIVSGALSLEIKPGHSAPYTVAVSSWKQGKYSGLLSFVATEDMQEAEKDKGNALGRYEVYFSLEIICEPAAPVGVVDVRCAVQSSQSIEIPVSNLHAKLLMLDVKLDGDDLTGAKQVSVPPRGTVIYTAAFSPGRVGKSTGSVIFQSELVGEFWYELQLYALPPPVMKLPETQCRLGKWTRQLIPLINPTAETLKLTVVNSNPRNYTLEMAGSALIVKPHSSTELGVRFSPSWLGEGNHRAEIAFSCPQLQEWRCQLSGCGLAPEREEPVSISCVIGSQTYIIIPFTNPTDLPATLSITLTDDNPSGSPRCQPLTKGKGVFSIPLKYTEAVQINARASLDVHVLFSPHSMELQQTWLCITMKPLSSNAASSTSSMRSEQEMSSVSWIYPIRGIPMEAPVENSLGVIQCEAGCQLEKKVDVLLIGCVPGKQDQKGKEVSGVLKEDFLCEVQSDSGAARSEVESCVSAFVEAASRKPETGNVTISLKLIYTPQRPHRCSAVLVVQCSSGELWKFPFTVIATGPQVDDVIHIEAAGLGKTSAVGFHLTNTSR
ncbi:hypothetical protein LDENG_00298910 [Lucifuga dentata]|nr:hypothetical protein LDENG_00298910 [Lucifuga dentata]